MVGANSNRPTSKMVDFATAISEMIGVDLPEKFDWESYSEFISEHIDEFYEVKDEIRGELYRTGKTFQLYHSYGLGNGFCGEDVLGKNPEKL